MSRRLSRFSLLLVFLLSSEVWAIGLGDIRLDSALNEPLQAEIELLSATPEELSALEVAMASGDTFARYGIDRPFYLSDVEFNVVGDGPNGPIVQLRSRSPITEPFLTFLVEASWPSGRLLREYTVLLDPPTYAPPVVQQAPAVTAPRRSTPSDSGRIERQPEPAPQPTPARAEPRPAVTPPRASQPAPQPTQQQAPQAQFDTTSGGDYVVQRRETLWGIASRMRPDSRLTMNQTMLAIYEANRDAFGGNINLLKAGAALRIPSADEVFQISRGDALAEVQRQHAQWGTGAGYTAPPRETRPSLQLVPPDEEPAGLAYDDEIDAAEPLTREQEIENRIAELEAADVPDQPSLIDIRDNELATLREELANIRGEVYEPPVEDVVEDAVEDPFVDADDEMAADDEAEMDQLFPDFDEPAAEDAAADDVEAEPAADTPSTTVRSEPEPGIVDQIIGALTNFWAGIAAALVVVAGLLIWFMRRGRDDVDDSGPWETLDADELSATGTMSATETIPAPSTDDESIVVVEQESDIRPLEEDTAEVPIAEVDVTEDTGTFGSLEDTFSSETAVNLDQTDPIAEADFHMAYGLYDQAADLINGALESEPSDKALMSKLCEIYFVWGNRDAFIDAAGKLKAAVGDGESSEWDKIVIMGQQIAADHALFAGAGVAAATKEMDLSFEAEMDEAGALDMDFGGDEAEAGADVIDLGAAEVGGDEGVDFLFEEPAAEGELDMSLEPTAESPTIESPGTSATVEMPPMDETVESPTLEQAAEAPDVTSELPSLDESLGGPIFDSTQDSGATAEINLDDLDLDVDGLAETELASLDIDLESTGTSEALEDTGINEQLEDTGAVTGKNPEIDPNETGVREGLDLGDLDGLDDLDATGEMRLAPDETGASPMLDPLSMDEEDATDIGLDDSLLDATGLTQVLSDDLAVETASDVDKILGDDDATMLASLDDAVDEGEDEFDFAKTEALPPEAFTGNTDLDETGEMPAVAETDVDLDLDDLTAALQVSAAGDTVEQLRDDATVEQPRPSLADETSEVATMSLAPEDMSEDLHEARTMTEVGTKLDLARAYVDMGDPAGARSILEEVLDEGDEGQRQQAQQLLDTLPS